MAAKTPLAVVKEKFGEKAKLVEALEKLTGETSGSRARTRTRAWRTSPTRSSFACTRRSPP